MSFYNGAYCDQGLCSQTLIVIKNMMPFFKYSESRLMKSRLMFLKAYCDHISMVQFTNGY